MLKKKKRRILSFLLVCILTLSLPFAVSAATTRVTLFTMSTIEVHDLLTTDDSGKKFLPGQFGKVTLYVDGMYYHTDRDTTRNTIRTGACYWDGSSYSYRPGLAKESVSNQWICAGTSMKSLNQQTYYYGFVKNLDSAGHIGEGSGSLYYVY